MITGESDTTRTAEASAGSRTLRIAYTPDSDDAFNYYAWEHGRVALEGCSAVFERDHIIALNRAALSDRYDVVAISSAFYPRVADRYAILAVGNSVGRGYGPVLVSKRFRTPDELSGRRIAVGGIMTTGAALAAMYCPGAELIEMRYDLIADAVAANEFSAGVMIHEELLRFPQMGLHEVCDLGAAWCADTGLPLPVGLNVARRALGRALTADIARTCRDSLLYGMAHFDEAFAYANRFGRGCARQHVAMFSNEDTLCVPDDVRRAMHVMFSRVERLGMGPSMQSVDIIDAAGEEESSAGVAHPVVVSDAQRGRQ